MMVILGYKLGFYEALTKFGPMASDELALKTNTTERYVREWLASEAAADYLKYDSINKKFSLPNEMHWFWQMSVAQPISWVVIRF